MTRTVYVNGRYRPYAEAAVHAEDRGFQFGDAVYEVCEVRNGCLIDEDRHMQRLKRSLGELRIAEPMQAGAWARIMRETIRRNRVTNGVVYLQVSRGASPRDFLFPPAGTEPTVVCLARATPKGKGDATAAKGIAIKTMPDIRWSRCDIKTVMLLPASLAKEAARADGARDAWFVDAEGYVTEGASSNAWIVDKDGQLVTRTADHAILRGVTRMTLMDVLEREGVAFVERPFTVKEAKQAREAFLTSASSVVMPVVSIDGQAIGNGEPGLMTLRLRETFHRYAQVADP